MQTCCMRRMSLTRYILTHTEDFLYREISLCVCSHCENKRLLKKFTTAKGDVLKSVTRGRKTVQREFEEFEPQIQSIPQNFGSWRNARGFRYFKGFKTKKGETGGIYSLCTDIREQVYKAKLRGKDA